MKANDLTRLSIETDLVDALPPSCRSSGELLLKVDAIEIVDLKDVDSNAAGFTFF